MATLTVNQKKGQFGNNPYGNVTALVYQLQIDNKGLVVNSNHQEIPKANDIIELGELPEGFVPFEYRCVVESAFTAGAFDVGFAYKDGVDSTELPQKETGFLTLPTPLTAKDGKSEGVLLAKAFPKSASLNLKVTTPPTKGANAGTLTIYVIGILKGHS